VFGGLKKLVTGRGGKKDITYDEAKALARSDDADQRRELAARGDIEPEILYFLAEDKSADVRRTLALNDAAPRHADLLLARDADDEVRTGLAGKIAKLAPGLSAGEQDKVRQMTYEALEILAQDQVTRVRQILSETLKDVADAPPEVIRRLARDADLVVAGPVIQFSPVLTDDDLLEIIAGTPPEGGLEAISNRHAVSEDVTDAIYKTNDVDAITAMLGNASAQIREETLDRIIDMAPDVDPWHDPLVRRPHLTSGAAMRLARFVADGLLETLTERKDLDPETAEKVREVVDRRLAESEVEAIEPEDYEPGETPLSRARDLHEKGELNERKIAAALGSKADKKGEFVRAAVAVLAGVKTGIVERAQETKTAKGIVALAWKAGLSVEFSVELQTRLAQIQPREVLKPKSGEFPLTEEEMNWQLDFLAGM